VQALLDNSQVDAPALLFETDAEDTVKGRKFETDDTIPTTLATQSYAGPVLPELGATQSQETLSDHAVDLSSVDDDGAADDLSSNAGNDLQALCLRQLLMNGSKLLAYTTNHIRVQQVIGDLATAVIRGNEKDTHWSWRSRSRSISDLQNHKDPERRPLSTFLPDTSYSTPKVRNGSPEEGEQTSAPPREPATPGQDVNEISAKLAALERILQEQKSTPSAKPPTQEAQVKG
jgi:hypothetical protein